MHKKGFSLVEILVASAIMILVVLAVMNAFSKYVATARNNVDSVKATFLAEEGIEAVKIMRDTSWNQKIASTTVGNVFRISWNGSTWATTSAMTLIDGIYDRTIVLDSVYRDSVTKSVSSSGSLDNDIKKVTVTVSWKNENGTSTKTLSTYITNLFAN